MTVDHWWQAVAFVCWPIYIFLSGLIGAAVGSESTVKRGWITFGLLIPVMFFFSGSLFYGWPWNPHNN